MRSAERTRQRQFDAGHGGRTLALGSKHERKAGTMLPHREFDQTGCGGLMRFAFTDEQEQFRAIVRRFLRERAPITAVRQQMATTGGFDRGLWQQLNDELGLAGVHLPEAVGGQGFGFVELGIVLEELGRALTCAPYFATAVLAAEALLQVASADEQRALLPAIASGQRIATLAWVEADGRWDVAATTLTATPTAGGPVLDGRKKFVLDGVTADLVLVVARAPGSSGEDGISLCAVDAPCSGLDRRALATIDTTRRQAELVFERVPARLLGTLGGAAAALTRTLDRAAVALACEMTGGARALLASAVEYAKLRMQFGRPIGSFQAIKHKCAELLLEVELAGAAANYAAAAIAEDDPQVPALAALAKAVASDAYMHTAAECIQIHGGIGFTWDHDTQLWYKRAKSSEVMFGDASYQRERYMQLVEATA